MQRYRIYILFVFIVLMSFFSGVFNFLIWNDFSRSGDITLPLISSYISLGAAVAYLSGWILLSVFSYRRILSLLSFGLLLILIFLFLSPELLTMTLVASIIAVGIIIGMWNILKNILFAYEIEATGWKDTTMNGLTTTLFIVSLLLGSIAGNLLFESFGRSTYEILFILLFCMGGLSFFLKYEKVTVLKKEPFSLPFLKNMIGNYAPVILSSCFVWSIVSAVSQILVQYSNTVLQVSPLNSSILLVVGAVGIIAGNVFSSLIHFKRSHFIALALFGWALCFFGSIFFINSYAQVFVVSFLVSFFFGVVSNLIDAQFLSSILPDPKKNYVSSLYGFLLSISIFVITMLLDYGFRKIGISATFFALGIVTLLFSGVFVFSKTYRSLFR